MFRRLLLALGLPVARPAHGPAYVRWYPGIPGVSVTYYQVECDGLVVDRFYTGAKADRLVAEINAHPTKPLPVR